MATPFCVLRGCCADERAKGEQQGMKKRASAEREGGNREKEDGSLKIHVRRKRKSSVVSRRLSGEINDFMLSLRRVIVEVLVPPPLSLSLPSSSPLVLSSSLVFSNQARRRKKSQILTVSANNFGDSRGSYRVEISAKEEKRSGTVDQLARIEAGRNWAPRLVRKSEVLPATSSATNRKETEKRWKGGHAEP
ncbi:hypothetical protein K0M31_005437 [Melipona bicolor]|uniref:Uncharacterized protein n=1 Tax=Melipona bicolor TaxID=60889 RepID=A0AA40FVC8_9HYME|nr:hypothetical protein K0M31_005437 [Melipona bicolor]